MTAKKSVLELATSADGETTVVWASGSLDIATADQLESAAREAMSSGSAVVVDVSGLALCDSTGLGTIVRLHRHAQSLGQQFAIRNARRHVADLLAMTGISKVIPVLSTED